MQLEQHHIEQIKAVLEKYLESNSNHAFIFGSRVLETATPFSDIDIGIEGKKLNAKTMISIRDELDNTDIPYLMQVVDFNTVSESFKSVAKQKILTIY